MEHLSGKGSVKKLKTTIRSVLEDCYSLDQIGIDHGELSSISKHVLVGETKSSLIDFESASTDRRVSNVTSITQAIFIGSGMEKMVKRFYKIPAKEKIIEVLRTYKKDSSRENFENILKVLKL